MPNLNLASIAIPSGDLQDIQAAIKVLQDKLLPHLVTLSAADRKEMPKMGDKTVSFVSKAAQYARSNPNLLPSYVDIDAWERDLKGVDQLGQLQRPLEHLLSSLDDTLLAAGSEAYASSLTFYQAIKGAARNRIHGAQAISDDLGTRFPSRSRASNGAGDSTATPTVPA